MIVSSVNSMKIYRSMVENPPIAPKVPIKQKHIDPYKRTGKNVVSVVATEDRKKGIKRALELIGGIEPMKKGLKGNILLKPNCNTDDPYPRDTHYNTIRSIAEILISSGISPANITVGDMSGRARGLPTRATMENLGITKVTEELGLNISYFEEEDWVTIEPPKSNWWPDGIKIPRTVYEADRIIFTPILRSHSTATFTCSLKLGVGLIDAEERDWLHNGEKFYEKMMDINLAYQVDLVIADVLKMNIGFRTDPKDEVEPKIITASNNMVASDAVSAALMKRYDTVRVSNYKTQDHIQFKLAERRDLGKANTSAIDIVQDNLIQDIEYTKLIDFIKSELK
jgi:uncharacterized protein (DUF362 family)